MPQDQVLNLRLLRFSPPARIQTELLGPRRRYTFRAGRFAIYHALRALAVPADAEVLVPAYICSTVVDAVLAYGATPAFYGIGRDCQPCWQDLETKRSGKTKALLMTHYFGFPQDAEAFRKICTRHSLCLIEDCAHLLWGEKDGRPLGSIGDASVFSWQKLFPLYDGGELVLNQNGRELLLERGQETVRYTLKSAFNLSEEAAKWMRNPLLRLLFTALEKSRWALRPGSKRKPETPDGDPVLALEPFERERINDSMSFLSHWILKHSDIPAVIKLRRANYEYLCRELSGLPGIQIPFPKLPEKMCPWVLPIILESVPAPDRALRSMGIPVMSWRGVRHPAIPKGEFGDSDFLYEQQVFLPVHQSLRDADLQRIASTVRSVLGKGKAS